MRLAVSRVHVGTLAVLSSLYGCDSQRAVVGPIEAGPSAAFVEVSNPGSVTITSETGIMRIGEKIIDFGSGIRLTGTVSSTGALTIPSSGIVFPAQFMFVEAASASGGLVDDFTVRIQISPTSQATGQLDDVTSLNLRVRIDLDGGPLDSNCRIEPVNLSLSSSKTGGVGYDQTTGRLTITDQNFAAPGAQGCGSAFFGAVNYNDEINNTLGIPGSNTGAFITAVINPKIVLNAPPTLTPPAALLVGTNTGCTYVGSIGTATASDDDGSPSVTNDAPAAFALGTTTVTWTATDAAGNTTTATQQVTVSDDDAPVITAPADLTVSPNAGANYVGAIGTVSASDNCSSGADVVITSDAPASFPPGTTTVTWTATDASGNTASALQRVNVDFTVEIDIIPGTSVPIRLRGPLAIVTVLVRSTPDADGALIRPATATLGDGNGTDAAVKTYRGTPVAALVDVDGDGDKDLLLIFNEDDLVANGDLTPTTATLVFRAERTDGVRVVSAETVTVSR